jgi:hypothetical protein
MLFAGQRPQLTVDPIFRMQGGTGWLHGREAISAVVVAAEHGTAGMSSIFNRATQGFFNIPVTL